MASTGSCGRRRDRDNEVAVDIAQYGKERLFVSAQAAVGHGIVAGLGPQDHVGRAHEAANLGEPRGIDQRRSYNSKRVPTLLCRKASGSCVARRCIARKPVQ